MLNALKKEQYNRTDPDATLMSKPAHNLMAYNAQIAVDGRYKFIVATDVTSEGSDKKELHRMAKQTKEIVDNPDMTFTADKGYYSAVEIKKCADDNITTVVPPIKTGQEQRNKGKFGKERFVYDPKQDGYICPNNEVIPKSHSNHTSYQRTMHIYRTSSKVCRACQTNRKRGQTGYFLINEPIYPHELAKIRKSVNRQAPFGEPAWQEETAIKYGLLSTLRRRGRPKK